MSERYNGWTNYATWAVNLRISHDQDSLSYWSDECAWSAWNEAESPPEYLARDEEASKLLANRMKEEHEEGNPLNDVNNVYSDLLSSALSDVNWDEIASHYIDDLDKD